VSESKYNVIDLFCGCGGFSHGFLRAGFNICMGIDIWDDALATFQRNFPNSITLNEDISIYDPALLTKKLNLNNEDIDVIVGGPPCQGFSVSGKRNEFDPRNELYKSFVRFVDVIKPKIFIMENVPGIVRLFSGNAVKSVLSDFTEIGYNLSYETLSADAYGVPQQRRRVFFVGLNSEKIRNTTKFLFPLPTHGNDFGKAKITSKEAISDLDFVPDDYVLGEDIEYQINAENEYQVMMREASPSVLNHTITLHKPKTKEIIAMVPDGGNYKSLPKELWDTRKVNIAWTRMDSNKPCFTIDTGHNHHFHYRANRVPTVRESARIQSFPDIFEFIGNKTSQLKQVGNAVPPLLAEVIANSIMSVLNEG